MDVAPSHHPPRHTRKIKLPVQRTQAILDAAQGARCFSPHGAAVECFGKIPFWEPDEDHNDELLKQKKCLRSLVLDA